LLAWPLTWPLTWPSTAAAVDLASGASSGLPVPRFVSLKADRVNVRAGPTKDHHVAWIFTRSGLPVEITAEFDNWRRIRDWEGAEGWVYHSLLSGRRTVMVTAPPSSREKLLPLRQRGETSAPLVAQLEPGVVGAVRQCTAGWCRFSGQGFDGWIEQIRLFGVYPNEKLR
jgi:SH3-like domain-containing protein